MAVAAATAIACVGGVFGGGSALAAKKPPKLWDPRVLPLAEFVEEERDLEFKHPVEVQFASVKRFKNLLRDDSKPTKKEQDFDEQIGGELLALGLVSEGVDFGQATEDLTVEGTLGFYDSETEELVVRGKSLKSVDLRVTVVHELTHALQDQHFNLDKLYDRTSSGSEGLALDFLVEGDATFIEDSYLESLSQKERDQYYGEISDFLEEAEIPEDAPYALDVFAGAPYVLGAPFVYALDPEGGTKGRNRAFRHPPKTEEVLIDPLAFYERQRAKKVPKARVEDGEKKAYDAEQFGVLTLYLMLATRIDLRAALEAVTGWGGDSYLGFQENGDACVRINITGDTRTDTDELEAALVEWQATMPEGAADVVRSKAVIAVTACEAPGITAPSMERFDSAFYNVLGQRIYVVLDLVQNGGLSLEDARCAGDLVSTDPKVVAAYDQAVAENREPTDEDYVVINRAYLDAYDACGLEPPS
jgi:hypothetical protein